MRKIVLIILLLGSLVSGVTVTWDNGDGNGLWNTGNNWSDNVVPDGSDDVVFDNTSDDNCTMGAAPTNTIKSLTVAVAYDGVLDFSG